MVFVTSVLSMANPVFASYIFYCCVLVIKVLVMAPLTVTQRINKMVLASPEDVLFVPDTKVAYNDPDIERVRRAHRNDLENIPVFFVAAFAYMMTDPSPWLAITLFRVFTLGRVLHSIVYAVVVVPQPARAIAWFLAYFSTWYMALATAVHFVGSA